MWAFIDSIFVIYFICYLFHVSENSRYNTRVSNNPFPMVLNLIISATWNQQIQVDFLNLGHTAIEEWSDMGYHPMFWWNHYLGRDQSDGCINSAFCTTLVLWINSPIHLLWSSVSWVNSTSHHSVDISSAVGCCLQLFLMKDCGNAWLHWLHCFTSLHCKSQ